MMTDAEKLAWADAVQEVRLTARMAVEDVEDIASSMVKLSRRKAEALSRMEAAFDRLRSLLPKADLPIPDEVPR